MKNPPHPGELIREEILTELGLSVAEVELRLGVSRVTLSRVVDGRAGISPNLAVRLELAGDGTAQAWLAMQSNFDVVRELRENTHEVKQLDAG